mmetsp:Transcript_25783/g.43016  ORF Transcript_25783/g.43016 Transcript_25783/m.43016 type:complete len:327 (+) Transcript_25783:123-1103(+)
MLQGFLSFLSLAFTFWSVIAELQTTTGSTTHTALWVIAPQTNSRVSGSNNYEYISRSVSTNDVANKVREISNDHEMMVLLTPHSTDLNSQEPSNVLHWEPVRDSIEQASKAYMMTDIQSSNGLVSASPAAESDVRHSIVSSDCMKMKSTMKIADFLGALSNGGLKQALHNNQIDSFELFVDNTVHDREALSKVLAHPHFTASRTAPSSSLVVVATAAATAPPSLPVPATVTVTPAAAEDVGGVDGVIRIDSTRQLGDTTTDSETDAADFSIYASDGKTLYMTPDMFTGLMTFLFMLFVAFTGLSCMNSIQGMSFFYDKVPAIGKEA